VKSPHDVLTALAPPPEPARALLSSLKTRLWRADRPLFALFQSVGTQALITLVNLATGVMTARLLGPDGRGIYTAVSTWPQFFATLAVAGLNSAIVFRMRKAQADSGAVAGAALALCAVTSLLAMGTGLLLVPYFMSHYSPHWVLFAQICLVSVLINSLQMVIKQSFAGAGRFAQCNLANLLPQVLYLLVLFVVFAVTPLTPGNALLALLGSGAIALLAALPGYIRGVRPTPRKSLAELPRLAGYAARAWPMDAVFTIATYLDRLVLIPLLSPEELGLYGVAFSFSRVVLLSQPAILSVMFSHMAGRTAIERRQLHDHALRFLFAALLAGCVLLWLAGDVLLSWTYGREFVAAHTVFRLLVIEASLAVLSQVTAQLFLSDDRPGVVSIIQIAVLVVSIALLLLLVPAWGAVGAAFALVGAGSLRWMLFMGATKLIWNSPLPRLYLIRDDLRYLRSLLR
jgi:enterobacterial common antigen flippase